MRAVALTLLLARLAPLRHNAVAERRPAQEEAKSDVGTAHEQAGALLLPSMVINIG